MRPIATSRLLAALLAAPALLFGTALPSTADTPRSQEDSIIGCGNTTVVAGEPVHGTVVMNEDFATWIYSGPLIGGTLHELGHVLGFGHPAGLTNADSVMGVPIPANNTARTTLSSFDRGGVRLAYRASR